jgi:hypothetical protein
MRLIERVRLKRVRYEDLDKGDEYLSGRIPDKRTKGSTLVNISTGVGWEPKPTHHFPACDTTKYPPESVTYDIVGIDKYDFDITNRTQEAETFMARSWEFYESEIETIYE